VMSHRYTRTLRRTSRGARAAAEAGEG
jgi:hypothetical protein